MNSQIDWQKLESCYLRSRRASVLLCCLQDDSASGDSSATEPTDNPYEGEAEPETYASLETIQPDGTACDINGDGSTGD